MCHIITINALNPLDCLHILCKTNAKYYRRSNIFDICYRFIYEKAYNKASLSFTPRYAYCWADCFKTIEKYFFLFRLSTCYYFNVCFRKIFSRSLHYDWNDLFYSLLHQYSRVTASVSHLVLSCQLMIERDKLRF